MSRTFRRGRGKHNLAESYGAHRRKYGEEVEHLPFKSKGDPWDESNRLIKHKRKERELEDQVEDLDFLTDLDEEE